MPRRTDEDFAAEIRAHIELEADRLVEAGLDPAAARAQATRMFGNVLRTRERFYDSQRWIWLEHVVRDVRYACRGLRSNPAFLITTVATLALGLGLITALFTVFNAYVLRPFAVRDPHTLHQIIWRTPTAGGYQFRWREFEALAERRDLFDAVLASTTRVVLSEGRPVVALFVSGNYFSSLAPAMRIGRPLAPFDTKVPGASPVAVLTDEGWTRLAARDPAVIGREIPLNGATLTVVGVLRPEFSGLDDTPRDVMVPVTMFGPIVGTDLFGDDQPREVGLVTRLGAGVGPAQVESALGPFIRDAVARPEAVRVELRWLATPNPLTPGLLAVLSPVFVAFLLVLLTACANVSNMLLARAQARHREIAMRLSIGASRGRVIRQLLTEGLVIATLAAVGGLAVSVAILQLGTRVFVGGLPASVAALVRVAPLPADHRVFAFALAIAACTTVAFALMPALHATRLSLTDALRGHATTSGGTRLRNGLVISQVAVSLVLLVSALTLVRNGLVVDRREAGFRTDGVYAVFPSQTLGGELRKAAEALVGDGRVGEVAASSVIPFSERLARVPVEPAPGRPIVPTSYKFVSPEFFRLLDLPIVHGRGFTDAEGYAEAPVAIVSESGAAALWPGMSPLGRTVRLAVAPADQSQGNFRTPSVPDRSPTLDVTIVGVARDAVNGLLIEGTDPSHVYLPTSVHGTRATALLVASRAGTALSEDAIRDRLRPLNADPLALEVYPLSELREQQMFPLATASWIGSLLAGLALVLSVSGLYGVLTFLIGQRTREIGIRVALGAGRAAVTRLVVSQAARLAGLGAIVGVAFAAGALKLLGSAVPLRSITWIDGPAFLLALVLVATAMTLAALVPAWRATRVDPAQTLRVDG
jgi:predicted permease